MTNDPKVYRACIIKLTLEDTIPAKVPDGLTAENMQEIARGRICDALARFMRQHLLKVEGQADGSVKLRLDVSVIMGTAPANVPHTPILFQEIPKERTDAGKQ